MSTDNKAMEKKDGKGMCRFLLAPAFLLCVVTAFLPVPAQALEISSTICNLITILSGSTATAIATLAVMSFGLMTLFGKTSWGTIYLVAGGIVLIFGGAQVMNMLGGQTACQNVVKASPFDCKGAAPIGNLFDNDTLSTKQGACTETASGSTGSQCGIFARTLYFFKNTVGQAMSQLYCAVQDYLKVPMAAAASLFVIVCGLLITTGMVNFTIKEAGIMMFKLALVWAFAMDPTWGIGIGYRFFMGFAEEGSNMVLSAIPTSYAAAPSITAPDAVLSGLFNTNTTGGHPSSAFATLSTPWVCLAYLEIFGILLLFLMPLLIFFIFVVLIGFIALFCRTILGYLEALVLITFLFVFAPLFLGFALFRTTYPLFDSWLKHLTGYSLQMVIMFTFMVMLAMVPFAPFFVSLMNTFRDYSMTIQIGLPIPKVDPITFGIPGCGICDYTITPAIASGGHYVPASIACNMHWGETAKHAAEYRDANGLGGYSISADGNYYVMPIWNILQHSDFTKFVIVQVLCLQLISKVLNDFLKKAPEYAAAIGKLPIAAALGGVAKTGSGPRINHIGLASISGAYHGFMNNLRYSGVWRPHLNLREAIMGRREVLRNEYGEIMYDKNGKPLYKGVYDRKGHMMYAKVEGGLLGGFLHGAHDESTIEGKHRKLLLDRRRREEEEEREKSYAANRARRDAEAYKGEVNDALEKTEQEKQQTVQRLNTLNQEKDKMDKERQEELRNASTDQERESIQQKKDKEMQAKLEEIRQAENEKQRLEAVAKQVASDLDAASTALKQREKEADIAAQKVRDAEYEVRLAKSGGGGSAPGILETRDELGRLTGQSSMDLMQFSSGDETEKAFNEQKRRMDEILDEGHVLKHPDTAAGVSHYGFMTMGQGQADEIGGANKRWGHGAVHNEPAAPEPSSTASSETSTSNWQADNASADTQESQYGSGRYGQGRASDEGEKVPVGQETPDVTQPQTQAAYHTENLRTQTLSTIKDVESRVMNSNLPDNVKQEILARLGSALNSAGSAMSDSDIQRILDEVNNISV